MRIVVFGTGKFYINRKQRLDKIMLFKDEVIAFVDNRAKEIITFEGVPVYHPESLRDVVFDRILLMSASADEMKRQLLALQIPKEKIITWEEYQRIGEHGKVSLYFQNLAVRPKKVLLISQNLHYDGGSLACVYAAMALTLRGYQVWLGAPGGDSRFIREMVSEGVNIAICPSLPLINEDELPWVDMFDFVIVNVLPMVACAYKISCRHPVLWWIHEANEVYPRVMKEFPQYMNVDQFEKIHIVAVSECAQQNFNERFPKAIKEIMPYGIPDCYHAMGETQKDSTVVFAIIGNIYPLKGQDIFLQAIQTLTEREREKAEFWLIGGDGSDAQYVKQVRGVAESIRQVRFWGKLNRKEIMETYKRIDVVVCASWEETFSIVVTEGMMSRKVIIAADAVGHVRYIRDGDNGLVFETGNGKDLAGKIKWVMSHEQECETIRKNARKTYEEFFTLEKFGERLEMELNLANREFDL